MSTIWEHFNYPKEQFYKDYVDANAEWILLSFVGQAPHNCTTTTPAELYNLIKDEVHEECAKFIEARNVGLDPKQYRVGISCGEIGEIIFRVLIARLTNTN